ncbi:MAG: malate dehydrogenase [Janthinobacterium lividum]
MRVWGAGDVDEAAAAGRPLQVSPGDLVTPLAMERARDLEVEVRTSTAAPTAAVSLPASRGSTGRGSRARGATGRSATAGMTATGVNVTRPPSAALHRRGAPLPTGVRDPVRRDPADRAPDPSRSNPGGNGHGMMRRRRTRSGRVVVVGAGHVGVITALRLADADAFDEVVLVDVVEGLAAGVALDLSHSAAIGGGPEGTGFATHVRGATSVEEAGRADYVVVTAGRARQPGMSRNDLLGTNAAIVGDVARRVAGSSPDAVILIVTNPLDEMTYHAWRASGFPAHRVIGMAGVLDSARFRSLVAAESGLPAGTTAAGVEALALGSHGEEMVLPLSVARVRAGGGSGSPAPGRPLADAVAGQRLAAVVDRTRASGAEVVALLRSGSAYLTPGTSAARMVLAMTHGSDEVLPASVLPEGHYGIENVYVGLPVRLGPQGVREVVELPLAPTELAALREAATRIRERLDDFEQVTGSTTGARSA